jgi:hypothetical protein
MKQRQCSSCTKQIEWGCEAELVTPATEETEAVWFKPAHLPERVDGEESYACPRQPFKREPRYWERLLLYYGMYKQGFLPGSGAVMDQSNKAIEIFQVLDVVNQECDEELRQRAQSKSRVNKGDPAHRRGM